MAAGCPLPPNRAGARVWKHALRCTDREVKPAVGCEDFGLAANSIWQELYVGDVGLIRHPCSTSGKPVRNKRMYDAHVCTQFAMMSLLDHSAPETNRAVGFHSRRDGDQKYPNDVYDLSRVGSVVEQGIA